MPYEKKTEEKKPTPVASPVTNPVKPSTPVKTGTPTLKKGEQWPPKSNKYGY